MKKILTLILAGLLAVQLYSADASALATSTDDGVTTTVTTGRAQADIALNADGSLTFTVYPAVTRTSPSGKVIGTAAQLDTSNSFPVTLPAATVQAFLVQIKAAYTAKVAADAKAIADAAAAKAATETPATP